MKAFTLMTAMPPTKGHMNLIRFAASLGADETHVIVCTQPTEPFYMERYRSIRRAAESMPDVKVHHLHRTLAQDPATPGFWDMWKSIMEQHGMREGDLFVSSEIYGRTMAKVMNGIFMPYDPQRELYYTKATKIRQEMVNYFHDILPEFQENLRTRVTVFGAESTGKTTLSKELSYFINGHWLFEWARPYLETVGPDITVDSMTAIWKGQAAIQRHAKFMVDKPFVIQDTDLFSTIGYWEQPHWAADLGPVPKELIRDAYETKSDLYIITRSNIPFEKDPIRYGGDRRESPDEYWIALAEKYGLNYMVLEDNDLNQRLGWAAKYSLEIAADKARSIAFDRNGF